LSFDNWIFWVGFIFIILGPIIFKWLRKREANSSSNVPNEAPVKWRKSDISENRTPFWGWAGASSKGFLRISSDGIYCADFSIPFTKINKATVYSPRDHPFGKGSYSILRIETSDTVYDFSISPYRLEKIKLPVEIVHEETEIVPKVYSKLILPSVIFIIIIIMLVIRLF